MSTADYPWRSRFLFGAVGDVTDWETTLPVKGWTPTTRTVGGSRTAAAGRPASHVVRRDYNLRVDLRLYETELPSLYALIEWGQLSESLLWLPDANESATRFLVYLEAPLAGEEWEAARDANFGRVFGVPLVLRRVDGYAFGLDYFECGG
jgi:hypothetical protein